jgi:catechol 2,3-dioxygenase-like lactoylglutathione lyase family enzyme
MARRQYAFSPASGISLDGDIRVPHKFTEALIAVHRSRLSSMVRTGLASTLSNQQRWLAYMAQRIGYVAMVVRDYDEALQYFTKVLDFDLIEDTRIDREKRWVLVAPRQSRGTLLLLARAATPEQASRIGNQTRDYHRMKERGVNFREEPREEPYGTVAVFEDICGNRWDLLQLKREAD